MLDGRAVDAAAKAVISVVDEDRGGKRPVGPEQGGYYTLEGAVAAVFYEYLDDPFERVLRRAIKAAEDEESGLRLGHLDLRDLEDYDPDKPETEENIPRTRVQELQELLDRALEELKTLREHQCEFFFGRLLCNLWAGWPGMSRLKPGMVVMVYRHYAIRQRPIGKAELVERIVTGLLPRGGQLEHWRVRYFDPPDEDSSDTQLRPESVTIRTDEPDLRPGADPPQEDYGPSVLC